MGLSPRIDTDVRADNQMIMLRDIESKWSHNLFSLKIAN